MAEARQHIFSGNIYIFHAFDIGEDINLQKLKKDKSIIIQSKTLPKYFKNYHMPLTIELPHPHESGICSGVKIYNFGAISLTYKISFEDTLENVKKSLGNLSNQFREQSVADASALFKKIDRYITKPKFFQTESSYLVVQVDPIPNKITTPQLKESYGGVIASALRFELETLSEYQKNEILEDAIGYFRGDFIVIDTEAAFVYDKQYHEILDLFEFANIQHLELRYFDRLLNQQLNLIYEQKARKVPLKTYLPFFGTLSRGPVDELSQLKVDISVITERLESTIGLVGEPYFSEVYSVLVEQLGLKNLKKAINQKLEIIKDVRQVFQHKIDNIHEDLLTVLIIILIFIELIIGLLHYLRP